MCAFRLIADWPAASTELDDPRPPLPQRRGSESADNHCNQRAIGTRVYAYEAAIVIRVASLSQVGPSQSRRLYLNLADGVGALPVLKYLGI